MTYAELIAFLERAWIKSTTSETAAHYPFDELRALLDDRGNPQSGLGIIHVTGSKGKGSTSTLSAALLREHGVPAGTFVSPHLEHVEERIAGPNGVIDREELAARMTDLLGASSRLSEDAARHIWRLLMVAALEHFRDTGIRHAAVEVSVGGRYDPTNVLDGDVACITSIGLEHVPRLGRTLAEIAAQKVAIVKPGRVCVTAPQTPEVADVIRAGVALAGSRLIRVGHEAGFDVRALDNQGVVFDAWTPYRHFDSLRVNLLGRHQAENATIALCAVEQMLAREGKRLEQSDVARALAGAAWPGRLERLDPDRPLLYDGAHTAESAAALSAALAEHFPDVRWTFVIGLLTRRDATAMIRAFGRVAERVIAVPVPGFDALAPDAIVARAAEAGICAEPAPSVEAALDRAGRVPTCVAGTLYLYGETRRAVNAWGG